MNGPEHYAEAERLLDAAAKLVAAGKPVDTTEAAVGRAIELTNQQAQVHATLALAATRMAAS